MRHPSGLPSWPVLLLAGREKAGKSYSAALASASNLIDRTFWVSFGEKDPDEYGAIKGARFEIAEHDGTLGDMTDTFRYLLTLESKPDEKPHLWVLDSGTRVWMTLKDKAAYLAEKRGSRDKNGDVVIGPDLWNKVTGEWVTVMNLIRAHRGPVIITARLDTVAVMENGRPTKAKTEKVQGQKMLAYDVDAIVEMPERGRSILTGARSVIYTIPKHEEIPDFTVDGLWRRLGLDTARTSQPQYSEPAPVDGRPRDPAEPTLEEYADVQAAQA